MRIRKFFVAAKIGLVVFAVTFLGVLFWGSHISFFSSARAQIAPTPFVLLRSARSIFDGTTGRNVWGLASLFFAQDITEGELAEKYRDGRLKVLIVPGHDNIDGGSRHNGVPEAEYTAKIGQYLHDYLSKDANIQPILMRNRNGYTKEFADYFSREETAIWDFITGARGRFKNLSSSGAVETSPPPIQHIRASTRTTTVLYGVNKWANEHGVDIVLHIHLNDYPKRSWEREYDGYSLYIPDAAFPNHAPSRGIAESLASTFARYWAKSNMHLEKDTIIEDPDLIALGSYGSLRAASVLLEYGYIYESKFQTDIMLNEAAFRTYEGLLSYFDDRGKITDEFAWFSPYEWTKPLSYGVLQSNDVAAFQSVLLKLGFYPPSGTTFRECPVSGNFKNCTREALYSFQARHGIFDENDVLGYKTRQTLNALF